MKKNNSKIKDSYLEKIEKFKDAPVWTPKKIKKETKIWFKYLK